MKEYTDKQVNSMILFLRVNNIAEMYYLENDQDPDRKFYCYRSDSWLTRKQVISTALDSGWKRAGKIPTNSKLAICYITGQSYEQLFN